MFPLQSCVHCVQRGPISTRTDLPDYNISCSLSPLQLKPRSNADVRPYILISTASPSDAEHERSSPIDTTPNACLQPLVCWLLFTCHTKPYASKEVSCHPNPHMLPFTTCTTYMGCYPSSAANPAYPGRQVQHHSRVIDHS